MTRTLHHHSFSETELPRVLDSIDGVTSDWLTCQLANVQDALERTESLRAKAAEVAVTKKRGWRRGDGDGDGDGDAAAGDAVVGFGGDYREEHLRRTTTAGTGTGTVYDPRGAIRRLAELEDEVRVLSLASELATRREEIFGRSSSTFLSSSSSSFLSSPLSSSTFPPSTIGAETQRCVALAEILSRHDPPPSSSPADGSVVCASGRLYLALLDWYRRLHDRARARSILIVRKELRARNYPHGTGSCNALSDELASSMAVVDDGTDEDEDEDENGNGNKDETETFSAAAEALVKLQLTHDRLMRHVGTRAGDDGKDGGHPRKVRLDLIDELCRPIVARVRYHFMDKGDESIASRSGTNKGSGKRLDSLPRWLFDYVKGLVSEGPYDFIREDLQPSIDAWRLDLTPKLTSPFLEPSERRDDMFVASVASWREYESSTSYFLSEMSSMCLYVLHSRNFFSHPSIVGANANPIYLCNAVEQLLLFDSYISKLLAERSAYPGSGGGGGGRAGREGRLFPPRGDASRSGAIATAKPPPRLIDKFVASNKVMMKWWTSVERQNALSALSEAESSSSSSSSSSSPDGPDRDTHSASISFSSSSSSPSGGLAIPATSPISSAAETFLSQLHSARSKAEAIGCPDGRRIFVANVIVPLCSRFTESLHDRASALRDVLVRRKKGGAPPTDDSLKSNFKGWIEVITASHLASSALLSRSGDGTGDGAVVVTLGADEDLGRAGRSLERLRDAMIEECGSSFVETVLGERAKLASYLMRCPHMLSSRASAARHASGHVVLSPDLDEAAHILSVALGVCDRVVDEVRLSFGLSCRRRRGGGDYYSGASSARKKLEASLTFAPLVIKENIARRVEEKLLEVALDIHGMIPVVGYGGALQFRHDMGVLSGLFLRRQEEETAAVANDGDDDDKEQEYSSSVARQSFLGTFARLADVTSFMALDGKKFSSLRDAFFGLVRSSESYALDEIYSDTVLPYEALEEDATLLEEAKSMLQAKGFACLEVEDAVSVINRRRV